MREMDDGDDDDFEDGDDDDVDGDDVVRPPLSEGLFAPQELRSFSLLLYRTSTSTSTTYYRTSTTYYYAVPLLNHTVHLMYTVQCTAA